MRAYMCARACVRAWACAHDVIVRAPGQAYVCAWVHVLFICPCLHTHMVICVPKRHQLPPQHGARLRLDAGFTSTGKNAGHSSANHLNGSAQNISYADWVHGPLSIAPLVLFELSSPPVRAIVLLEKHCWQTQTERARCSDPTCECSGPHDAWEVWATHHNTSPPRLKSQMCSNPSPNRAHGVPAPTVRMGSQPCACNAACNPDCTPSDPVRPYQTSPI